MLSETYCINSFYCVYNSFYLFLTKKTQKSARSFKFNMEKRTSRRSFIKEENTVLVARVPHTTASAKKRQIGRPKKVRNVVVVPPTIPESPTNEANAALLKNMKEPSKNRDIKLKKKKKLIQIIFFFLVAQKPPDPVPEPTARPKRAKRASATRTIKAVREPETEDRVLPSHQSSVSSQNCLWTLTASVNFVEPSTHNVPMEENCSPVLEIMKPDKHFTHLVPERLSSQNPEIPVLIPNENQDQHTVEIVDAQSDYPEGAQISNPASEHVDTDITYINLQMIPRSTSGQEVTHIEPIIGETRKDTDDIYTIVTNPQMINGQPVGPDNEKKMEKDRDISSEQPIACLTEEHPDMYATYIDP